MYSERPGLSTEVPVGADEGLRTESSVHCDGLVSLPKERLTDAHRLYPGTGILPIREIKAHFDKIGYDRMVSIEIFRPEYWDQDPFDVAAKAKAATEEVLGLGQNAAGGSW